MSITRRQYLQQTTAAMACLATATGSRAAAEAPPSRRKIGMCDWSLGRMDASVFELARQIGLDGVQVSVGTRQNNLWLRQSDVQQKYAEAAREQKISICSLALGELNHVPLMSEPRAAIWVADAIEAARAMKQKRILLAFFATGELKEGNANDMRRVIEALQELAPRAEKAGVVLGVESYLSADGHLKILDAVKSRAVQVYYDLKNTADAGYDPLKEMKAIGRDRICEIHFKDTPFLENGSGKVNWPAAVEAIHEMDYRGWIVLETGSPHKDIVGDTRKNLAYVRKLFGEKV